MMPERMSAFWEALSTPFKAMLLSVAVASLRIAYDDTEVRRTRRALEAILCGFIAFAMAEGMESLGLPSGAATFCGGFVGLLGADKVRELGRRYAQHKLDARGRKAGHAGDDEGGAP